MVSAASGMRPLRFNSKGNSLEPAKNPNNIIIAKVEGPPQPKGFGIGILSIMMTEFQCRGNVSIKIELAKLVDIDKFLGIVGRIQSNVNFIVQVRARGFSR